MTEKKKAKSLILMPSADRSEIELKVACDFLESEKFDDFHEFYDVTA